MRSDTAVPAGIVDAATVGSRSGSSSGPSPASEVIEATPQHPFWVVGRGWMDAVDLRVGDTLLAADGTPLAVYATRTIAKQVVVYNFTVDTLHTYTVGQFRTVVHNVNCGRPVVVDQGFNYRATWPGDDRAIIFFEKESGGVSIEYINRSNNPSGSGGTMIAYAVQDAGISKSAFEYHMVYLTSIVIVLSNEYI